MSYVPNTSAEQHEMLRAVGVDAIEQLLAPVPEPVRLRRPLDLPAALPEPDLKRLMLGLSEQNADLDHSVSFLGAGSYDHYVPSVVPHLVKRSEFYTSYTPYQPEISQGMLQAIYEFQTMACQLTGLDVANASLYDGSTAVVEAALLAVGPAGTGDVLVSRALRDDYDLPYDRACMHEFVFSANRQKRQGAQALDIAKRLLDFGMHPPTIYFPLIVPEALMIEPTETETKETLDEFIAIMRQIAREAREQPEMLREAPHVTVVGRLDQTLAARKPDLRWQREGAAAALAT